MQQPKYGIRQKFPYLLQCSLMRELLTPAELSPTAIAEVPYLDGRGYGEKYCSKRPKKMVFHFINGFRLTDSIQSRYSLFL